MRVLIILLIVFMFPTEIKHEELVGEVVKKEEEVIIEPEIVTLTIYSPTSSQTDSTPHLTASGFKIDPNDPGKHRIIAVSRDLKRKWKFNTKVRILNAGKYNGVYTVKDLMNKRHKKRVDVLVSGDTKPIRLRNIKIIKI